MTQNPSRLDATAVRELVALRLMLDDATRRADVAHHYTRGSAVVALDAAVERVAYLVALRRNLHVAPRDTLADLHSKLVQSLEQAWKPTMWPQVRHLHEARNGAQHKGLVPAAEDVPGWAVAARAYVTSLVEAEHDVDLDRVVLAAAVRAEHLSELLRAAEAALADGDIPASVQSSLQAFDSAVESWSRLHRNDHVQASPLFHPELGLMGDDRAAKAISRMQRAAVEASFAPSPAEHEWFTSTRKESLELLDADDAERVLSFAFSWIVALELAATQWVPDRRRRAAVVARRVRTTAEHATVAAIRPVQHRHTFMDVTFELADVPGEDAYERWAEMLAKLLDRHNSGRWLVAADGTVTLTTMDGALPHRDDVHHLQTTLAQVEDALEAEAREQQLAAAQLTEERAARERSLDTYRHRRPDWVTDLTFENSWLLGPDQGWRVTVSDEVGKLRFPNPGGSPYELRVWDVIRTDETNCILTAAGEAYFPASMQAVQVVDALAAADPRVQERLIESARERTSQEQAVADVQADLAAALARAARPS